MAIMADCILTDDYAPKAKDRGDTVLCFHYGQSNSGVAPSGPVIDVRTQWDDKVLTFDDVFRETVGGTGGWGIRLLPKRSGLYPHGMRRRACNPLSGLLGRLSYNVAKACGRMCWCGLRASVGRAL